MTRTWKKKIKGLLFFPVGWPLTVLFNLFCGGNFQVHYNPIEELKYIMRD